MTKKRHDRQEGVSRPESRAGLIFSYRHFKNNDYSYLTNALEPFGVPVTPALAESIDRYLALLLRWNQKINLTGATDSGEILTRHVGESLFGVRFLPGPPGTLYDIGAGAGFPGLFLKLARPEWELVLVESDRRKAAFLSEAVRILNLDRVRVLAERFDQVSKEGGAADVITARALGGYPALLRWARQSLRPTGCVILWIGAREAAKILQIGGWAWDQPVGLPLSRERVILRGTPSAA